MHSRSSGQYDRSQHSNSSQRNIRNSCVQCGRRDNDIVGASINISSRRSSQRKRVEVLSLIANYLQILL